MTLLALSFRIDLLGAFYSTYTWSSSWLLLLPHSARLGERAPLSGPNRKGIDCVFEGIPTTTEWNSLAPTLVHSSSPGGDTPTSSRPLQNSKKGTARSSQSNDCFVLNGTIPANQIIASLLMELFQPIKSLLRS